MLDYNVQKLQLQLDELQADYLNHQKAELEVRNARAVTEAEVQKCERLVSECTTMVEQYRGPPMTGPKVSR